ncbi:MAG: HTH domain-containing protein [Nanoarchaeota archaeon]
MNGLNYIEKKILKFLQLHKVAFPINYIAKKTEFSWETVQSYLESMEEEGYVIREEWQGKERWRFNFEKYGRLKRKYR